MTLLPTFYEIINFCLILNTDSNLS
jgi:hypothetical protein